jgi:hypothetical protein
VSSWGGEREGGRGVEKERVDERSFSCFLFFLEQVKRAKGAVVTELCAKKGGYNAGDDCFVVSQIFPRNEGENHEAPQRCVCLCMYLCVCVCAHKHTHTHT